MFRIIAPPIAVIAMALTLVGCTQDAPSPSTTPHPIRPTQAADLKDPLPDLRNSKSDFYIGAKVMPALHVQGTGPSTVTVQRPASSYTQLKFFITCSPSSDFTVTMSKFYSGPCSPSDLSSSGSIPLPVGTDPLNVTIDVPKGVQYWLVAIPIE